MNYNENCSVPVEAKETIKSMLENMDAILTELKNQVNSIDSAVCGKKLADGQVCDKQDESMQITINRQRNEAEEILKTVFHIREALW